MARNEYYAGKIRGRLVFLPGLLYALQVRIRCSHMCVGAANCDSKHMSRCRHDYADKLHCKLAFLSRLFCFWNVGAYTTVSSGLASCVRHSINLG